MQDEGLAPSVFEHVRTATFVSLPVVEGLVLQRPVGIQGDEGCVEAVESAAIVLELYQSAHQDPAVRHFVSFFTSV